MTLPQASRRMVVAIAFIVAFVTMFSAADYFHRDRNAADRATMLEMNYMCRGVLEPFNPTSPVAGLARETMDNIELAYGSYCASGRARISDALSLYHVFGEPSAAGVCQVAKVTRVCLQYLHQRVSTRQQRLPADFDIKINELFKRMKIDAEFTTPDRLTYEPMTK